jgi:predicted nucleic acid-binding protein
VAAYVDTSALLRVVERRGDRALVEAALQDAPMTSVVAEVECWSSIHKRWHDGDLTLEQRDGLLRSSTDDALGLCTLLHLDADVLAEARAVATRFPLRTLDAIHLATAVLAGRRLRSSRGLRFCTADGRQAAAARGLFGAAAVDLLPPSR